MKSSQSPSTKTAKTSTTKTKKVSPTVRKAQTKSKLYSNLNKEVGTWNLRVASSTRIGVKVFSKGTKKGSVVEMILPSTTPEGVPCTVRVCLSGRQARAVYETLARHQNKN